MARGTKVKLQIDGQAPSRTEINTIAQQAVSAEDNAFSAVIVPTPNAGTIKRGVVPPSRTILGPTSLGPNILVSIIGASPTHVKVWAHTAVVGPLDQTTNNVITAAAPTQELTLANGSGTSTNKRWDLVYATMMVDVPQTPVLRKIKDLTSKVISVASTSTTFANTITYGVVTGTEAASNPTMPALPADPVGGYNIPLAYVRVVGNVSTAGINPNDIVEVAEVYTIKAAAQPANQFSKFGSLITTTGAAKATDVGRYAFLPGIMSSVQSRFLVIRIASDTFSTGTMADGTILDDSVDWTNRLFRGMAHVIGSASYAWVAGSLGTGIAVCPSAHTSSTFGDLTKIVPFMGQSMYSGEPSFSSPNRLVVARFDDQNTWATTGTYAEINVDGSGRLVLKLSGHWNASPSGAVIFVWLDATGQFYNE